jgi:NADPH:quinone reductase-like Zn-dependent oxidoreductase
VGDQHVLVDVRAAGVNLLDAKVRAGSSTSSSLTRRPFVLGPDLAGVVSVSAWFGAVAITPGGAARVTWI